MKKFLFFTLLFLALQTVAMEPEKPRRSIRIQEKETKKRKIDAQELLLDGALDGDIEKIHRALQHKPDINKLHTLVSKDNNDRIYITTPLGVALINKLLLKAQKFNAAERYHQIIAYLLENGASPNASIGFNSGKHFTFISEVAQAHDELETLLLLLKYGADPNVPSFYDTPVCAAITCNNLSYCKPLIDHGADPGSPLMLSHGWPALIFDKIDESNIKVAKLLLDNGARIDDTNALDSAIDSGKLLLVKLLLEHGADTQSKRQSALFAAIFYFRDMYHITLGSLKGRYTIKLVLKYGAHVNEECPDTEQTALEHALHLCNLCPYWGLVQELLSYGAHIPEDKKDVIVNWARQNFCPLSFAAAFGTLPELQTATQQEYTFEQLQDALMWAATRGNIAHVQHLLDCHADPKKAFKRIVSILMQHSGSFMNNTAQPLVAIFHLLASQFPDADRSKLLGKLMARTLRLQCDALTEFFIAYRPPLEASMECIEKTLARPLSVAKRAYFEKLRKFLTAQSLQETILQKGGAVAQTLHKNRNQLPENLQSRLERLQKNNKLIARRTNQAAMT